MQKQHVRQLAQILAGAGRRGDTMLAHINPREAKLLDRVTDGGSRNPTTGLPEFADSGEAGAEGDYGGGGAAAGSNDGYGGYGGEVEAAMDQADAEAAAAAAEAEANEPGFFDQLDQDIQTSNMAMDQEAATAAQEHGNNLGKGMLSMGPLGIVGAIGLGLNAAFDAPEATPENTFDYGGYGLEGDQPGLDGGGDHNDADKAIEDAKDIVEDSETVEDEDAFLARMGVPGYTVAGQGMVPNLSPQVLQQLAMMLQQGQGPTQQSNSQSRGLGGTYLSSGLE